MKRKLLAALVASCVMVACKTHAQTYDTNNIAVQTFAGSGFSGHVDGIGQQTMFHRPSVIVADSGGTLFVWDSNNARIRKITSDGVVSTFAGGGTQQTGTGTNVNLSLASYSYTSMAMDSLNTIWIAATSANRLYKITSSAVVTFVDLPISPSGICVDSSDNVYLSASERIYRRTPNGVLSVFVGSGNTGYADGNGIFTAFHTPMALATDAADNIYVWDSENYVVRKIDQSQNVTTFAGKRGVGGSTDGTETNAVFYSISQMCFDDDGNLLLACAPSIRKVSPTANVTTIAGSFSQYGYVNGSGASARFDQVAGICSVSGVVFVSDYFNQRIRSVSFNPQPEQVSSASLQLNTYSGLQITGTVGRAYQIESSPDMTNWTTRTTLLLNSNPYLWIDQNPISGNQFYRAFLLP